MMRFPVRAAFGLTAVLIAPSFVMAQAGRDVPNVRDLQPSRAFSRISFSPTPRTPRPGPVSRPPGQFDRMLEGARLPEITSAPDAHGIVPDCVIRIVPVDPRVKSQMPMVKVDARPDPKSVIKVSECQPRD
jgi:hypothetical protein